MRVFWAKMIPGPFFSSNDPVVVDMEGEFIGLIHGFFRSYFVVRTDAGQIVEVPISECRILKKEPPSDR